MSGRHMSRRIASLITLFALCTLGSRAYAQAIGEADAAAVDTASSRSDVTNVPVRFAHDDFFLRFAGRFASTSFGTDGNLPGALGLEDGSLAEQLPGVSFRRNGTPFQSGEWSAWEGDGRGIDLRADRLSWDAQSLNLPPSGDHDPVLWPVAHDSVFVLPAPLMGFGNMELNVWRDPHLPESTQAIARHTNGPNGYSHTGGRFRSRVGRGWEFDGQLYRVFMSPTAETSNYDAHALDFEMRRYVLQKPVRIRFRQNRGTRDQLFRWTTGLDIGTQRFLLSHLDLEAGWPVAGGEWLAGFHLRHEDQRKVASSFLDSSQKWFTRSYGFELSRLWVGGFSRWISITTGRKEAEATVSLHSRDHGGVQAGVWWAHEVIDLTVTGSTRAEEDTPPSHSLGAALGLRVGADTRVLLHAGTSHQAPSDMLRFLAPTVGPYPYSESGDPDLPAARHRTVSVTLRHASRRLKLDLTAQSAESRKLAVWQPADLGAGVANTYRPLPLGRRYDGAGGVMTWSPLSWLELFASGTHLFTNEWIEGGMPTFAPEDSWSVSVRVPLRAQQGRLRLTPQIASRGVRGGTLPEAYATVSIGLDIRLKQLHVFVHEENLRDREYLWGGAAPALSRHTRYGFRWELWN